MAKHGENIYLRKDGRYEGRYVIGKKADGRTAFGYIYGKKYREVKKQLAFYKGEQFHKEQNPVVVHGNGTVSDWIQIWLEEYVRPTVKESTYGIYRRQMERYILPLMGKVMLAQVNQGALQTLYRGLINEGWSEKNVQIVCRRFIAALKMAKIERGIAEVPVFPYIKKESPSEEPRCLTSKEQLALEQSLDLKNPKDLAIMMGLYTGLRVGECVALRWCDISLEEQQISITHTIQRISQYDQETKTTLIDAPVKTRHSVRCLPLIPLLTESLRVMKGQVQPLEADYVFSQSQKPLEPRRLQYHIQQLAKKLELKQVHFHTLRHTFASRCVEKNVDIKTVSELLGHCSVRITLDCYCHSSTEQKRRAVEQIQIPWN